MLVHRRVGESRIVLSSRSKKIPCCYQIVILPREWEWKLLFHGGKCVLMAIKYLLPSEKSNFLSALPGEPQFYSRGQALNNLVDCQHRKEQSLGKYGLPLTKLTD